MTYRDELEATRARADAAELDREQARAEADAAEGRAAELEQELRIARDEARRLRTQLGPAPKAAPDMEQQLSMAALDASLEKMEEQAERARRQRPLGICVVTILLIAGFLWVTRLYDPLFEFLIDDLWGR